ncbi:MAG: DUF3566 domain-containing protein [Actinomycetota bacterium]|nr:DUF3566 domain-containing protein [Actinomycetota bacterium]
MAATNKAEPDDPAAEGADNGGTTPPWQRVTPDDADADTVKVEAPKTPEAATDQPEWPTETPAPIESSVGTLDDATVSVERPVIPGSAAPGIFGDTSQTPPRASVSLDGTGTPRSAAAPSSALRRPGRGPRRANLQVKRFDPWSVLKLSLVLGVALFFVWLVAVGALYAVLDGMGVWDKLNGISSELLTANADGGNTGPLISAGRVFGIAAIIGAINIVLLSALATVGAFVYNVSADLAGGLEVTLAERE